MKILTPQERLEIIERISDLAGYLRDSYGADTTAPDYYKNNKIPGRLESFYTSSGDKAMCTRVSLINKDASLALVFLGLLMRDLGEMDRLFWERKNRGE